jgi:hypothetical protein
MLEPTYDQNQLAAFRRWERRGGGDGYDKFDWYETRNDLLVALNYRVIAHHQLSGLPKKEYIGTKTNQRCRFCGRVRKPEDKKNPFSNEAHALPEFIGNEQLISYEECNDCNTYFSGHVENHLSEFINPLRTLLGMAGKTGVPKYKSVKSRIERNGDQIEIKEFVSDKLTTLDQTNNTVDMALTVKSYVPIGLYKCLTKMALSIMPEAELPFHRDDLDWIRTKEHALNVDCFKNHRVYLFFVPGAVPVFDHAWATVLQRKDANALLPDKLFVVGSMNLIFMSMLPLSLKDHHLRGKEFTFPRLGLPTIDSTVQAIPVDVPDKVKGLELNVRSHVDTFTKVR